MPKNLELIKLSFCGPGDVLKEIQIGREVVELWNHQHGEARGLLVKPQHWSSDSHPEMGNRPQAVINRQVLDDSDIVVAIFWTRFGTPTGVAASGTEEEIRRATGIGRKVMVYFSDLEAVAAPVDRSQAELLWEFRQKLRQEGLCGSFSSRSQFRQDFTRHLAQALNELRPPPTERASTPAQVIHGDHNVQVGRDLHLYDKPPVIKKVIQRREGAITSAQALQVQKWIDELAESTVGQPRSDAFRMWWSRFKNRFQVEKYEELPVTEMVSAKAWFKEQRAIQKRGLKTKLPDEWRRSRVTAIKAAMGNLGVTNETYYPDVARRLRMKKPFGSLTELTKKDLERVYALVLRDANR